MRSKSQDSLRQAATLTELLVALAIVSAVAALLWPSFGMLRKQALASRCSQQLKQIGAGLFSYLADHQGAYPPTRLQSRPDPRTGAKVAAPHLYEQLATYLPNHYSSDPNTHSLAGVWWCPADLERPPLFARDSYGVVMTFGGSQASPTTWDGEVNPSYDPRYRYLRSSEVPPSRLIYLIEFIKPSSQRKTGTVSSNAWPFKPRSSFPKPGPSDDSQVEFHRHGQRANALFLDGSVKALDAETLRETGDRYLSPIKP